MDWDMEEENSLGVKEVGCGVIWGGVGYHRGTEGTEGFFGWLLLCPGPKGWRENGIGGLPQRRGGRRGFASLCLQ